MRYLTVDGMLSGTGVRDSAAGGHINTYELNISDALLVRIKHWLSQYEQAYYAQFASNVEVEKLDQEGILICEVLRQELPGFKIDYYSNAKMRRIDCADVG